MCVLFSWYACQRGSERVNELKCALEPTKLVVDASCHKDATLLTVEGIFQFFFELKKRKSSLAEDLLCFVKKHI